MNSNLNSRTRQADKARCENYITDNEKRVEEKLTVIKSGKGGLRQTEYALLYNDLVSLGLFYYGAGRSLQKVKNYFLEAVKVYQEVLRLRGTESSGRIEIEIPEDPSVPFDIGKAMESGSYEEVDGQDYSLGNARSSLNTVYLASAINERGIAKEIAGLIWDPDSADYIGPDSEVCTHDEQHLAYAVRALFIDDVSGVEKELLNITNSSPEVTCQARMIQALSESSSGDFMSSISDLLRWHKDQALSGENMSMQEFIMSIPAIGLSAYAIQKGLINLDDLPEHIDYLPTGILTL